MGEAGEGAAGVGAQRGRPAGSVHAVERRAGAANQPRRHAGGNLLRLLQPMRADTPPLLARPTQARPTHRK